MEYILAADAATQLYMAAAASFIILNLFSLFLLQVLLPWQTKRLLKKWKIVLRSTKKLPFLRQLQQLVLNLSGTITYGVPAVTDIYPNGISSARLLALAAAIEKNSPHPVAEAIKEEAAVRGLELPELSAYTSIPGRGAEALMNRQTLSAGSAAFFKEQNIDIEAEIFTKADQLAYKGQIIVFVAVGKYCRGFITLEDKVKRSIPGDISFLRDMGIEPIVFTGCNRTTAKSYVKPSGIDTIRSELTSMDKAKEMLLLQTGGNAVGAAGRTGKFEGALQSAPITFALEYADARVKGLADVLIHTNSLATIATAKGISRMAYGRKKTGVFICLTANLLLILALAFIGHLGTIPMYGAFIPLIISLLGAIIMLLNQFPLRY